MRYILTLILGLTFATSSIAQELNISANDDTYSVISAQKGKSITLHLRGGKELTGTVRETTSKLIVLGAISGREFFDAVIPLEAVDAVLIRTKQ